VEEEEEEEEEEKEEEGGREEQCRDLTCSSSCLVPFILGAALDVIPLLPCSSSNIVVTS